MYEPAYFGAKPKLVLKSGIVVWSMMGDANASIPTTQPIVSRPMFGASPSSAAANSIAFVSAISIKQGIVSSYQLKKRVVPVKQCRNISKRDMKWNDALPKVDVDPTTYLVKADGQACTCEPVDTLPLTQAVSLF
jgi:urease